MDATTHPGLAGERVLGRLLGCRAWLLSYIRALVRDYALAEDVFQEVCLALLRRQEGIALEPRVEAYFLKAARHAALAAIHRRRRTEPLAPELIDALEAEWTRSAPPPDPSRLNILRRCVEKLQERARLLLELRYDRLLSGQALADRIGTTTRGAYVALSRVHRALRKCAATEAAP